jgi:hypothetical protein
MAAETHDTGAVFPVRGHGVARSCLALLRFVAMAAGLAWALVFILAGLVYRLQLYGDGSIFSYAVAVQDSWAFHFHNISGRALVWLYAMLPAEGFVALTKNAPGGIALYGFLFFSAPLLGLVATYIADRSRGRIYFIFACGSTALLCPMVFGAPTETWFSHALFWPVLAFAQDAPRSRRSAIVIFAGFLALIFTHPGALMFGFVIVGTLWLRGTNDAAFRRAAAAFLVALIAWVAVKFAWQPDAYISGVLADAALHAFDPRRLTGDLTDELLAAILGYGMILLALRRLKSGAPTAIATIVSTAALCVYWVWLDGGLHTYDRYYLRTIVLTGTPALGIVAAVLALTREGKLARNIPLLPALLETLHRDAVMRAAAGAFLLVALIHAIETAKFLDAWTSYKAALRTLALSDRSDPWLGDARFVSAARIDARTSRPAWNSTTPYLSILLAPGLAPARLVVDPAANYFWISCETATENLDAARAVPAMSRELIRVHACLHR